MWRHQRADLQPGWISPAYPAFRGGRPRPLSPKYVQYLLHARNDGRKDKCIIRICVRSTRTRTMIHAHSHHSPRALASTPIIHIVKQSLMEYKLPCLIPHAMFPLGTWVSMGLALLDSSLTPHLVHAATMSPRGKAPAKSAPRSMATRAISVAFYFKSHPSYHWSSR